MPVDEKYASISTNGGTTETLEVGYLITGFFTAADARDELLAESPPKRENKNRETFPSIEEIDADAGFWWGTIRYTSAELDQNRNEKKISFSTTGGTQHITQSRESIKTYYTVGGGPTSQAGSVFKGAIGVTDDSVDGCDAVVPVLAYNETHYIEDEAVTDDYLGILFSLTGRTNNADFKGMKLGESLFMGASGSQQGRGKWEIDFAFAGSPNATELKVGDITGIAKKGWEYLWVKYEPDVDPGVHAGTRIPEFVIIERIYDAGDFGSLGIGLDRRGTS